MPPHYYSHFDIGVYIDTSLTGWGIMDVLHPLRVLGHKLEIDHVNAVDIKATEIGAWNIVLKNITHR